MASDKLDMSLDDIIKKDRPPGRGGGRGGRGRRGGGGQFSRRGGSNDGSFRRVSRGGVQRRRDNRLSVPFSRTSDLPDVWEHDLYDGGLPSRNNVRSVGSKAKAKLIIRNLDFGVNDDDIRELFAEFGSLKNSAIHYDRSGRSLGTADVEYTSVADATRAMKQYNNVPLDGKPMKIEFEGGGSVIAEQPRSMMSRLGPVKSQFSGRSGGGDRSMSGQRSFRGRSGRGGGRGGGRGRGQGRREQSIPSKEDLDAELDAYTSKMDTS